jgi:hypothetical protein
MNNNQNKYVVSSKMIANKKNIVTTEQNKILLPGKSEVRLKIFMGPFWTFANGYETSAEIDNISG